MWRWIKRILAVLFISIVLVLLTGTVYQSIAGRRDAGGYPSPGRLIDVGGYRLHLYCAGEGSPTVILEAELGAGVFAWKSVQPGVSQVTRVCSYDRAGYGWSEVGPKPRTSSRIAKELHALLQNAVVQGPLVLVGHSLGGAYIRSYQFAYPDEVSGMVLVDATPDSLEGLPKLPSWMMYLPRLARAAGFVRFLSRVDDPKEYVINNSNKNFAAISEEEAATQESLAELRASHLSLGEKPLIVLTSEQNNRIEFWRSAQARLLTLSSHSEQIISPGGHNIPRNQPELVILSIRKIVDRVRSATPVIQSP